MNCLIIDDEPLARGGLEAYVKEIEFLQLIGCCEDPMEAVAFLQGPVPIDLMFLDIQMPKMTGMEFIKTLQNPPLIIITTAYPSFAIESFQLDVLDYLVKPITFQRFFKAANKAQTQFGLLNQQKQSKQTSKNDYFFVKCEQQLEKIQLSELLFVEAMQNYVQIHTKRGKFITLIPLKNIFQELPQTDFIQTHRSFIVAINAVESIEGNILKIGPHQIPISRSLQEEVKAKIIQGKLVKK